MYICDCLLLDNLGTTQHYKLSVFNSYIIVIPNLSFTWALLTKPYLSVGILLTKVSKENLMIMYSLPYANFLKLKLFSNKVHKM